MLKRLIPVVLSGLIVIACEVEPDRGRCLQPRIETHHTDARDVYECWPQLGFDGEIHLSCGNEHYPARDWTVTVCDAWEFPNGKAEKD